MEVMTQGFNLTQEIHYGEVDDPDTSSMRLSPLAPLLITKSLRPLAVPNLAATAAVLLKDSRNALK